MRLVEASMVGLLVVSGPAGFVAAANFIPPSFDVNVTRSAVQSDDGQAQPTGKTEKKAAAKKPKPYPKEGPGLHGASLPHCSPGEYSAGYICKASPPDHYVPVGSLYPVPCPANTFSPRGAQSKAQCKEADSKAWKLFS